MVRGRPWGSGSCAARRLSNLLTSGTQGAPPGAAGIRGAGGLYCLYNSLQPPKGQSLLPFRTGMTSFPGDRYYCGSSGVCPSIQCRGWGAPDQASLPSSQETDAHSCLSGAPSLGELAARGGLFQKALGWEAGSDCA